MAAYSSQLIEHLTANRNKPLLERCHIMKEILRTTSLKELRSSLPFLLHEIFDFERDKNPGWQLDKISRYKDYELFEFVRKMLSPEGTVMKVVNSLLSDPSAVYEFPLKCIPTPARQMIEGGAVPAFYVNKLQLQNFSPAVLSLNAFELFVFHLSYALVNPIWQARNQSWGDLYEYVYPTILDDMLVYFLPCDKNSLPSVPHLSGQSMRPTILSFSSGLPYNKAGGQIFSPSSGFGHSHRSLFKSSFLNAQKQHMQSMPVFDQAETEIWRSETFLQILTEFWLNQNSSNRNEFVSYSSNLQDQFMPSMNHVKMVRLLVKHMHHFANSATSTATSGFQKIHQSPLYHFKRSVIPHILQKKLYLFLRHAFSRWPLDFYFRMVLETWLSYIQPWRYKDFIRGGMLEAQRSDTQIGKVVNNKWSFGGQPDFEMSKLVDNKWQGFVEDNLLFYTVLTAEFIPRIYRMDMTSPYSAYMVYRVSRILSLPNLSTLIDKAECELFGNVASQYDLGGSYLSGLSLHMPCVLPSHLLELEGPNFQYQSFFSPVMKNNMMKVVEQLSQALEFVRSQQITSTKSDKNAGIFSSIFGLNGSANNVYTSPEYKRLPGHLEQSIINFCTIFNLNKPECLSDPSSKQSALSSSIANESMYLTEPGNEFPDCIETDVGLKLTDLGRRQLINKERKFDKFYVGDPDLLPIRSYENASLVRLFFYICSFINSHFKSQLISLYNNQNFAGRFAKVFLIPPTSSQEIQRKFGSPVLRIPVEHWNWSSQPRISLRFLASYRILVKFAITYAILSLIFEIGPLGYSLIVLLVVLLYGFVLASVSYMKHSAVH